MLQWEKISVEEWESITPPRKQTKWDSLLAEIEKGSIIKFPLDPSEKRGFRIGIARAAKARGYKVDFGDGEGFLAMKQGESIEDKPKRKAKTSPSTEATGEGKRRGRPRKVQDPEEVVDTVIAGEILEPAEEVRHSGRSRRNQPQEEEIQG